MKNVSDLYRDVNNTLAGVSCLEDVTNWENVKWVELLKISHWIKQLFVRQDALNSA